MNELAYDVQGCIWIRFCYYIKDMGWSNLSKLKHEDGINNTFDVYFDFTHWAYMPPPTFTSSSWSIHFLSFFVVGSETIFCLALWCLHFEFEFELELYGSHIYNSFSVEFLLEEVLGCKLQHLELRMIQKEIVRWPSPTSIQKNHGMRISHRYRASSKLISIVECHILERCMAVAFKAWRARLARLVERGILPSLPWKAPFVSGRFPIPVRTLPIRRTCITWSIAHLDQSQSFFSHFLNTTLVSTTVFWILGVFSDTPFRELARTSPSRHSPQDACWVASRGQDRAADLAAEAPLERPDRSRVRVWRFTANQVGRWACVVFFSRVKSKSSDLGKVRENPSSRC